MQQINLGKISLKAGEDLSTKMYYCGKLDASGNVVLGDANCVVIGVIDGKAKMGEAVAVNILGTTKVVAGGAISVGSKVICNANGKVISLPATSGTYNVFGVALQSAEDDGDIIEVLIRPESIVVAGGEEE